MSLSRVDVRNVYGMGQTQLYRDVDREDPKAILNGVAISGLVGVLRQLGDLAEFAAEIFHGIQEEVMVTASRSNQLKIRLQYIEATVLPLENAVLAQTTHIHFAYTAGLEWHPRIPDDQNHLIYNDLPHFIMDPYQDCRDPPRLHLLDKFDVNGPGSCLKRYSDPTYFRRSSTNLILGNNKFQNDNKISKFKKKSSPRSRDISRLVSMANNQSARETITSFSFSGQTSSSKTPSTSDMEKGSDLQDHHSRSFYSRNGSGYIQRLSTPTSSSKTGEKPKGVSASSSLTPATCTIASVLSESETEDADDNFRLSPSQRRAVCGSSCVSWEEKTEIVESLGLQTDDATETMGENSVVDALDERASYGKGTDRLDFHSKDIAVAKSESIVRQRTGIDEAGEIKPGREMEEASRNSEHETESEGDFFVDALNTIESESENDQGFQTSQEVQRSSFGVIEKKLENSACEQKIEQNSNSVKDSCTSKDGFIGYGIRNEKNASDEINHQDPEAGSDIHRSPLNDFCANKDTLNNSGGEDSITFTIVPGNDNSLAYSSNPLYDHGLQENKEPEGETYVGSEAIKIWTNGGLLGLKPSKPPILAAPSSLSPDCKTEERAVGSAEAGNPISSDGHETSFSFLGLSHKLHTNGLCKQDSYAHDRKTVPATIPEKTCDKEINEKTLMDPLREESPIDWITSSPPLQHMKISLNPADTLQASKSKLMLKLSDGDNNYNTFSSFQLLPETATSLPDSCSDDDSFCRSSPYMSDTDNQSLSNSEQWEESSESNERKEQERHAEVSPVEIESESGCVALNLSYLQNPAEPLPPPFPPVQWMVSKAPSEKLKDKAQPQQLQDALRSAFENHISLSTVNKELPNKVVIPAPKPEIKVHLKSNVREEKHSANEKESEAGDFLQQIRTQQFNLRPVVMTTKLSAAATTDPAISTKISAILEKANSIRQVVDSEDGDESDNTWSDT